MKEIKDFFEEIEKLEIAQGVIDINEAKRLVSAAEICVSLEDMVCKLQPS